MLIEFLLVTGVMLVTEVMLVHAPNNTKPLSWPVDRKVAMLLLLTALLAETHVVIHCLIPIASVYTRVMQIKTTVGISDEKDNISNSVILSIKRKTILFSCHPFHWSSFFASFLFLLLQKCLKFISGDGISFCSICFSCQLQEHPSCFTIGVAAISCPQLDQVNSGWGNLSFFVQAVHMMEEPVYHMLPRVSNKAYHPKITLAMAWLYRDIPQFLDQTWEHLLANLLCSCLKFVFLEYGLQCFLNWCKIGYIKWLEEMSGVRRKT